MKKKSITLLNVIVFAITIIIGLAFFGDWEDFKRGLQGAPPIEKSQNND
ncbi:hypothetical protein [Litoribacter populi]|nr:hypothetical protein [Litoribacter populi]